MSCGLTLLPGRCSGRKHSHRAPLLYAEGLRPVLLPVDGDSSIRSLADEIDRACEQIGQKVQRSSMRLEDLMLAVGCKTTSIACLQDIGQSIKASALIISSAQRVRGGVRLSLRWFDVKSGGDLGELVRVLPNDAVERKKILGKMMPRVARRASSSLRARAGWRSVHLGLRAFRGDHP